MASLDWAAIRTAIVVGLATVGLAIVSSSILVDDASPLAVAGFLTASAIGFLAAGAVAGWSRGDVPMIHGLVAAVLTALVLLVVGTIRTGSSDGGYSLAASGLALLGAASCGVAGALGADWLRRRRLLRRARYDGAG